MKLCYSSINEGFDFTERYIHSHFLLISSICHDHFTHMVLTELTANPIEKSLMV